MSRVSLFTVAAAHTSTVPSAGLDLNHENRGMTSPAPTEPQRYSFMTNFGIGVSIGVVITMAIVGYFAMTAAKLRHHRRHQLRHQQTTEGCDNDTCSDVPPDYSEVMSNPYKYPLKATISHTILQNEDVSTQL